MPADSPRSNRRAHWRETARAEAHRGAKQAHPRADQSAVPERQEEPEAAPDQGPHRPQARVQRAAALHEAEHPHLGHGPVNLVGRLGPVGLGELTRTRRSGQYVRVAAPMAARPDDQSLAVPDGQRRAADRVRALGQALDVRLRLDRHLDAPQLDAQVPVQAGPVDLGPVVRPMAHVVMTPGRAHQVGAGEGLLRREVGVRLPVIAHPAMVVGHQRVVLRREHRREFRGSVTPSIARMTTTRCRFRRASGATLPVVVPER